MVDHRICHLFDLVTWFAVFSTGKIFPIEKTVNLVTKDRDTRRLAFNGGVPSPGMGLHCSLATEKSLTRVENRVVELRLLSGGLPKNCIIFPENAVRTQRNVNRFNHLEDDLDSMVQKPESQRMKNKVCNLAAETKDFKKLILYYIP